MNGYKELRDGMELKLGEILRVHSRANPGVYGAFEDLQEIQIWDGQLPTEPPRKYSKGRCQILSPESGALVDERSVSACSPAKGIRVEHLLRKA
jgi:hypothetical protein